MCTTIAKNPLRTYLGLNCYENKNSKAWPKMGVLIRKKVYGVSERASEQTNERSGACERSKQYETSSAEGANE